MRSFYCAINHRAAPFKTRGLFILLPCLAASLTPPPRPSEPGASVRSWERGDTGGSRSSLLGGKTGLPAGPALALQSLSLVLASSGPNPARFPHVSSGGREEGRVGAWPRKCRTSTGLPLNVARQRAEARIRRCALVKGIRWPGRARRCVWRGVRWHPPPRFPSWRGGVASLAAPLAGKGRQPACTV